MNPLLFGSRERLLFGLHEPAAGRRQRRGVVLCAPWGQEYVRAHRSLKLLSDQLARAGCDVLRFDYYGTGDSAGKGDGVTLAGCIDDAVAAVEEIQDLAQARRVTVIGLRLGAVVASAAAARMRSVDRLVLWDPVSDGSAYVAELAPALEGDKTVEVRGFPLSPDLRNEIAALDGEAFLSSSATTLLIVSQESDEHKDLRQRLLDGNRATDFEVWRSPHCWVEDGDWGAGAVPVDILHRIVEWPN